MTSIFIKKGGDLNTKTNRHTGKMLCNDESRDLGNTSASQKRPKIASKRPEARRESGNRFSFKALGRNQTCNQLDLGLLDSTTIGQQISIV